MGYVKSLVGCVTGCVGRAAWREGFLIGGAGREGQDEMCLRRERRIVFR
jgi:hypothetical protein